MDTITIPVIISDRKTLKVVSKPDVKLDPVGYHQFLLSGLKVSG
jgi:hypothetical protein